MPTTELLLLVEDEALLSDVLKNTLLDAGFEVTVTGDGTKALVELETDATRFRAVITDIKIGHHPDGWQVGRRARELVHDMPIVYIAATAPPTGRRRVCRTAS
ncbi:MAG: response regulator [Xanthobacteraceae bacterium]